MSDAYNVETDSNLSFTSDGYFIKFLEFANPPCVCTITMTPRGNDDGLDVQFIFSSATGIDSSCIIRMCGF